MRTVRAVLLAIVATLALAGGIASTANADTGRHGAPSTTVDQLDANDPGLPPDQ